MAFLMNNDALEEHVLERDSERETEMELEKEGGRERQRWLKFRPSGLGIFRSSSPQQKLLLVIAL